MNNFIWLIFAHYIGDIALQLPWQADNKGKYWYVMLSHCMIWTCCISIVMQWLGILELWKVIFLFSGHFICDEIKSHQPKTDNNWWQIYPDQCWHLIQCLIVYLLK